MPMRSLLSGGSRRCAGRRERRRQLPVRWLQGGKRSWDCMSDLRTTAAPVLPAPWMPPTPTPHPTPHSHTHTLLVALQGVLLHFGDGDFLTLKTDDASASAIAGAVNARAARRAALRHTAGGAGSAQH